MNSNIYNKYEHSTLSKFDIIGSYFVNLYYNEFYSKSKNLKFENAYSNITDAYKNVLSSYLEFTKKSEFFKQIIKGIHTYCISTTRYTTMTHKECIDFMVYEFVPSNLWNSLRENQKNKLFHESIINCITIFTEKIISNHLHIIIDHRDQPENITILQDLFLSIILFEKDKTFSKFLNPNSIDSTNLDLFRDKIKNIVNDKKKVLEDNKKLKNKINLMDKLVKKNSEVITELQKNNKLILQKLELYKVENFKLKILLNNKNNLNDNNNNNLNNIETSSNKSITDNKLITDNNSIPDNNSNKSEHDNIEINSNVDNKSITDDNSNGDSDDFQSYFQTDNIKNNKDIYKFVTKKDNKINSELIFDDYDIDDYDK